MLCKSVGLYILDYMSPCSHIILDNINKGTLITSDFCKANVFNEFFVSVGTVDIHYIPYSTSVNLLYLTILLSVKLE